MRSNKNLRLSENDGDQPPGEHGTDHHQLKIRQGKNLQLSENDGNVPPGEHGTDHHQLKMRQDDLTANSTATDGSGAADGNAADPAATNVTPQ